MADKNRTLRELASSDSLFADFLSLFNFVDTYTCDICIDTFLCSICIKIEAALEGDISTDKVDVAGVNVAPVVKIWPSNEQPSTLELKPHHAFLEFNEKLPVIIASKLESQQEQKLLQILRKHNKAIR